jgi:hypothetical protein
VRSASAARKVSQGSPELLELPELPELTAKARIKSQSSRVFSVLRQIGWRLCAVSLVLTGLTAFPEMTGRTARLGHLRMKSLSLPVLSEPRSSGLSLCAVNRGPKASKAQPVRQDLPQSVPSRSASSSHFLDKKAHETWLKSSKTLASPRFRASELLVFQRFTRCLLASAQSSSCRKSQTLKHRRSGLLFAGPTLPQVAL